MPADMLCEGPARDVDSTFLYRAYGLNVSSELALPGLRRGSGDADVAVRFGQTPDHLNSPIATGVRWQVEDDRVLLRVDGVARYLIERGTDVLVTPDPKATPDEVAFGLLNGAVGPLLHQRGTLVLHAAAISTPHGAVAIAGPSGAGKSTLLLACLRRGAQMLTDDIAPLSMTAGEDGEDYVRIHSGVPFVHAWRDTAEHFAYVPDGLAPVRPGIEKFKIPALRAEAPDCERLNAVVVLESHHHTRISCNALTGKAAFAALHAHTRGLRIAEGVRRAAHFEIVSRVAQRVPVFRLQRPHQDVGRIDAVVDAVFEIAAR